MHLVLRKDSKGRSSERHRDWFCASIDCPADRAPAPYVVALAPSRLTPWFSGAYRPGSGSVRVAGPVRNGALSVREAATSSRLQLLDAPCSLITADDTPRTHSNAIDVIPEIFHQQ